MYMKRYKGYITKQDLTTENKLSRGSGKAPKKIKYIIHTRRKGIWNIPENF